MQEYYVFLLYTVSIYLCALVGLLTYRYIKKKPARPLPSQINPTGLHFKEDISFLMFIIDYEFKIFTKKFNIMAQRGEPTIKDEFGMNAYDRLFEELVISINSNLSPTYKFILSNYFTDDSLKRFIVKEASERYTALQLNKTYTKMYKNVNPVDLRNDIPEEQ